MVLLLEFVGAVLSAALLLLPIGTLPYVISGKSVDSGFVLAYCILAVHAVLLGGLTWRVSIRELTWSNLGGYCLAALALSACSFGVMELLSSMLNVVDSSHGGSVFIVLLGGIGSGLVGAIVISERIRRAL
jgi:hypothetical protein